MPSQIFTSDGPIQPSPLADPPPVTTTTSRGPVWRKAESWPIWINLALGIWLFISSWVWPHTAASFTNSWICGALIALGAIWALFEPMARWVDAVIAVWLFFSAWAFWHVSAASAWNNWILAVIVFVLALIPTSAAAYRSGRDGTVQTHTQTPEPV